MKNNFENNSGVLGKSIPGNTTPSSEQGNTANNTKSIPSVSLPKGGGAISGIEDKFQVNAITGTSSLSIPIPLSPSRNSFMPSLGLNYNSGSGNGTFGLGWSLQIPSISRKTQKELPQYKNEIESDTFVISGSEDLVPELKKSGDDWQKNILFKTENADTYKVIRYRPRLESGFVRIERWIRKNDGDTHWRAITPGNTHSYYGLTDESRIYDPKNPSRIYEWKLCRTHDDKGSITIYKYKKENFVGIKKSLSEKNRINNCTQLYLKKVCYGVKAPYYLGNDIPVEDDFLFKVVFDYGEHDQSENIPKDVDKEKNDWMVRKDPFSNYRTGFEIRTYRRCQRVLMFHCFDTPDLPHKPYLTKSLELFYDDDLALEGIDDKIQGFSYLVSARHNGHLWDANENSYSTKHLPDFKINYQQHQWNTEVKKLSKQNALNTPIGIKDKQYLWVDLFSEGISGILTEQSGGWFYKSNLGNGNFSKTMQVAEKPSFKGILSGQLGILELGSNGVKSLVDYNSDLKGFFKLSAEEKWEVFKSFKKFPNINLNDPNLRGIDLNGDGLTDLLITEEDKFTWYKGEGEVGFEVSQTIFKVIDEEKGPAVVFNDQSQSIFLADMCGDGLTDIVRIRNGEICYWPNLGYGHFGAKVSMENAPAFDHPDHYNPNFLRLADIDGSGTIDIIYLAKNDFRVWMNQNGNSWTSAPKIINCFPNVDNLTDILVLDFLGTGTSCIVHNNANPISNEHAIHYIDLMGSRKPHLMIGYENNTGKEVSITYKPSTHFYLEDKKEGKKWITKLPFPVHCVWKTKVEDKIRETVFTSSYRYSHGYFDPYEREYRGFARVEQLDTEDFNLFSINEASNVVEEIHHQPPVKTISWFHNGAFINGRKMLHQLKDEYFENSFFTEYQIPEINILDDLNAAGHREAMRACKGLPLRSEVYAMDDSEKNIYPYSASNPTFQIKQIQPKGNNKHACFQIIPSESISYSYDRNPADPRISHSFILETDAIGNVLKSAAVVYPRVSRPMAPNEIPDRVWEEQNKHHIAYNEISFTNDIDSDNVYRLRTAYETCSYEINGISLSNDFFFQKTNLFDQIKSASTILYEEEFTVGIQKRLTSHSRNYFIKDDFSGPLPFGELSKLAIGYKSFQLAFTKDLVPKYYGTKVDDAMLLDAQYVHSEGDEHWWTQSGKTLYGLNPHDDFYIPVGTEDVYGNQSKVFYDSYHLLVTSVENAIGHKVTTVNDYRTLAPVGVTDLNLNRSMVQTDELGMVIKSAIMGKDGDNDGDTLADPTTRMEYDLLNWQNNKKPNYVHTFAREKHGADNPRWQESYAYSDGGGGVIMSKVQVSPGKAKKWNTTTHEVEEVDANPRWLGNGRTIVNNKGNAIKSYDPYYSATHEYESESGIVETGVSPIFYYDPIGRNFRTENPDGTFVFSTFDAWHSKSYDANDTVMDSQWYLDRGAPDPEGPEPLDKEERAAWLAAKHHDTPAISYSDSLGRVFYGIADYGNNKLVNTFSNADPTGRYTKIFDQMTRLVSESYTNMLGVSIYSKSAEKGEAWTFTDVMGKPVKTWDNEVLEFRMTFDEIYRPISTFIKQGDQEILFSHNIYGDILPDATQRNLKGSIYQIYDQTGLVTITEKDFKGNATQADRSLCKEYKEAINWKAIEGLTDITNIDAAALPFLEEEVYTATTTVDALNRPISTTLPDQTILEPIYDEANMLKSLRVQIQGQGEFITFLENQSYDAKGQRQFVEYGNGLITNYFYDSRTFRLINLITKREGTTNSESLQNLKYTFDPIGNIVNSSDEAQQTHYFNNSVVKAENKFEYDALYQLAKVTGREHASLVNNNQRDQNALPFINQLPHTNNATAVRNYTETYQYDDCGNILQMKHIALGGNWTRNYKYAYQIDANNKTNRLNSSSLPGDPIAGPYSANYSYDFHGNMTQMPHLQELKWSFRDQLKEVDLGGGGKAFYVYAVGGNRVRKVIERPGGKRMERIYLGSVEIYREFQLGSKRLERNTLHISDNSGQIAQIDTKMLDLDNIDPSNPIGQHLIRYQYNNYLGSASMETNELGAVISYEEYHSFGTSSYRSSKTDKDLSLKRYRFTGKERDEETGFYYMGARYYAAWLGRWTSSDPAGFIDGLNLFKYCRNNPIMLHDPTGTNSKFGLPSWATPPAGANRAQIRALSVRVGNYVRGQGYVFSNTNPVFSRAGGNALWNFGTFTTIPSGDPLNLLNIGNIAPMTGQPRAQYGTPGSRGTRLTENEHIIPGAQLRDITRNPRTGESDYGDSNYRRDTTVRVERRTALDKTNAPVVGDNARTDRLRLQRNGVNLNRDLVIPSLENAYRAVDQTGSRATRAQVNRATLRQLGNLFSTVPLSEVNERLPRQSLAGRIGEGISNVGRRLLYSFDGTNRARAAGTFIGATGATLARGIIPGFIEAEMGIQAAGTYALANGVSTGIAGEVALLASTAPAAVASIGLASGATGYVVGGAVGHAVEDATGSRTAGVAAGTATGAIAGAAVGAAVGVWFFGVGAAPAAAIGGAIGGIAGFVGSFW